MPWISADTFINRMREREEKEWIRLQEEAKKLDLNLGEIVTGKEAAESGRQLKADDDA